LHFPPILLDNQAYRLQWLERDIVTTADGNGPCPASRDGAIPVTNATLICAFV
jgi:hypothetical protein